jgi:transcription antitermination factor NusG
MHTRPQQEKYIARMLRHNNIPFYLPLVKRQWRARDRSRCSHTPLFRGYLFVLADPKERLAALATRRIIRSVAVPDQQRLWNDLRQIEQLIATGAPIFPENRLAPRDSVVINSGPLAGLRGVILQVSSRRRFVVQVDFIQRGASVMLDDCLLVKNE